MATAVAADGEPLAGLALIAPPLAIPGWQRPGPLAIDGPLLVVAGSEDPYCPRPALATLATAIPEAIVTVIDGADHFFFTGLEALDAALADWAAKRGVARPGYTRGKWLGVAVPADRMTRRPSSTVRPVKITSLRGTTTTSPR